MVACIYESIEIEHADKVYSRKNVPFSDVYMFAAKTVIELVLKLAFKCASKRSI